MRLLTIKKSFLFVLFSLLVWTNSFASVTMLGNRIIYPSSSQDKTLIFSNNDKTPALVQIWTDINNPSSSPDNADGPFAAIPSIFNIDANSKQIVKIVYTGHESLPKDRESIFYFNYLSIPSVMKSEAEQNKLMLVVTNRLKIFYRPNGLSESSDNTINDLIIKRNEKLLTIKNPTPYYASMTTAIITKANKKSTVEIDMIAPFSERAWPISTEYQSGEIHIQLGLINDYGVEKFRTINIL